MANSSLNGIPAKNLPRAKRYEAGRALRNSVARESHAECPPASGRDPVAILAETDGARIPEFCRSATNACCNRPSPSCAAPLP